jgi:L-methionine (R)-S-oxide reductase
MAEELSISNSVDKAERYQSLLPQIEALIAGESDLIANLSNIAAALKQTFNFFWVGFYLVKDNELVPG